MGEEGVEEYTYRVCKSSWGVYVKLFAECVPMDFEVNRQAIPVGENIWLKFAEKPLSVGGRFCEGEIPYLKKGLQLVQDSIKAKSKYQYTLIVVRDIICNPCHFQEEGIIAAMIGWSAKVFEFVPPKIDVSFNKAQNKYEFDFALCKSERTVNFCVYSDRMEN